MLTTRVFDGKTGKEIKLTKSQVKVLEDDEQFFYDVCRVRRLATKYLIDSTEVWILHCSEIEFKLKIDSRW